jgi:pathogenesis-related protein 1
MARNSAFSLISAIAVTFFFLPTIFAGLIYVRTSSSDIDQYLSAHNTVREQHGAADLTWNDTLASAAQQWANGCIFEHSGGSLGPYGGKY